MKVFVLNGPKIGYSLFGLFCFSILIYIGFAPQIDTVIASAEVTETTYVAVVISGFGSGVDGTKEFLYMDTPFTALVEPAMPFTNDEIRLLSNGYRDVFLDITTPVTSTSEYLNINFNDIQGINIHGKSQIMQEKDIALPLLTLAKDNDLIVVDSLPKNKSITQSISEELNLTYFNKDIILDDTTDINKIEKNLRKAGDLADKNGYAVAIGHLGDKGGKSTAQAIKNISDEFEEKNIKFITLTELAEICVN